MRPRATSAGSPHRVEDLRASPAPRVFCIPARRAPIVAVLRRGPSAWSHLGRWDLVRGIYEPGSWLRGNLYPQRCDLSPDGRWFAYFTLKGSAKWKAGQTYVAISRLPWLAALAAWGTCGTWTRGIHFVDDRDVWEVAAADEGDAGRCRRRFGIAFTRPVSFAVERRHGWTETEDSPRRRPGDMWDEARAADVTMEKARPGGNGATRLTVQGYFAAFRGSMPGGQKPVRYRIIDGGRDSVLDGVQWGDWAADGRLLVATKDGRLQIRDGAAIVSEVALDGLTPKPAPPPAEAYRW